MTGAQRIAAERQRQIDKEGWTPEHDAKHGTGLVWAAICYAANSIGENLYRAIQHASGFSFNDSWPWEIQWDKRHKHGPIRSLEIAGALIAAEIDRRLATGEDDE